MTEKNNLIALPNIVREAALKPNPPITPGKAGDGLKPCPTPWCGGWTKPYVFAQRSDILGVCCLCCNLSTDYHPTEAAAVEQWNTRTPENQHNV